MKSIILALIIVIGGFFATPTETKAIDPVTIAILAPIAMKAAQTAAPYVLKGLMNGGKELLGLGVETVSLLRLPLGFCQCTFLAPWYFGDGIYNLCRGAIAPISMIKHVLLFPIQLFNVF